MVAHSCRRPLDVRRNPVLLVGAMLSSSWSELWVGLRGHPRRGLGGAGGSWCGISPLCHPMHRVLFHLGFPHRRLRGRPTRLQQMEEDGKEHQSDGMEAHLAASKGQVDTLRDLLSTSPALFGAKVGGAAVGRGARGGGGVEPNAAPKDSFGKTPIFYAIEIMCLPAVEVCSGGEAPMGDGGGGEG